MGRTKLLSKSKVTPTPSPVQSFSESIMEETIESAEKVINNWWFSQDSDHCKCASLFSSSSSDTKEFFTAVIDLQMAMKFLISNNPTSNLLVRAHGLIESAMKRLERELYLILKSNREYLDPGTIAKRCSRSKFVVELEIGRLKEEEDGEGSSGSSSVWCDDVRTKRAMDDLRLITDCMISCGYGKECAKVFKSVRKSVVKGRIFGGGCDHHQLNLITSSHKIDWEELDDRIKKWLKSFDYAVNSVFTGERILCDHLFSSSTSIRELCFSEVTSDIALSLLEFPHSVLSKCKKTSEKIFRFLDIYESISRNLPDLSSVFSFDSTSSIRSLAETTLSNLRESVRASLADFGSALHKDASKSPVLNGGVHPLTRYVMNYLTFLADYSDTLVEILNDWPLNLHAPLPAEHLHHRRRHRDDHNDNQEEEHHVSDRFAWLVLVLLCKLDRKTELYKDVSLSYLFLANNLHYVVEKVRGSDDLRRILGDEWVVKHGEKVKQYVSSYKRVGWGEVISALQDDDSCPATERERLRRFNGAFLRAHGKQAGWIVADYDLGMEIRRSLRKKIVPKYRVIYDNYRGKMMNDVDEEEEECVVKFAPEDLKNYFSEMLTGSYDGSSRGASVSSRSSSGGGKSDDDETASSWSCKVSPPHSIGAR